MKKLSSLFLLLIVLVVPGYSFGFNPLIPTPDCTWYLVPASEWTRVPEAPEYTVEAPIPLRVGILDDRYSPYELAIINEWDKMRLFDSLVYPYKEGDPVDVVIRLTTTGEVEEEGGLSRLGVDMLTDLTFGLSRAIVGRSATYTHDALAIIHQSSDEIGRYSVEVSSTVRWEADSGVDASGNLVFPSGHCFFTPTSEYERKADSLTEGYKLQRKRLAFELAKKIRADRQNLLSKLGKSQEEVTAP